MRQHSLERLPAVDLAEGEVDGRRAGKGLRAATERFHGCMALVFIQLGGGEGEEDRTRACPARSHTIGQR
jgi:hypothetical protein